jgi:hypothetical protein
MPTSARLLLLVCAAAACATRAAVPPASDPDPERARAALATLVVDNRTAQRLDILYRHAGRGGAIVGVGHVAGGQTAEMAPVPAGEPLVLIARTADGAELALPPRTLAIDGSWTWLIERSARFLRDSSSH